MNDSLRPETNKRNSRKCRACRRRKQKCNPPDRDWEHSRQKCDRCEANNRECGPNLKCSEEPVFVQQRAVVPENENGLGRLGENLDGSAISPAQNPPAPTPRGIQGRNDVPPTSVKNLEEKARSKLHEFHALGKTLAYISQPLVSHCRAHEHQQRHHDLPLEERLHELFLDVHRIAVEASDINEPHLAGWLHSELVSALDRYPRLVDNRKRYRLLKIAVFFQEIGHQWTCEHVLEKIASTYEGSNLPDFFPQWAESLSISSHSISCVLRDCWNDTVGGVDIDPNLHLSPLHAAVQHCEPRIIEAIFLRPNQARVDIEERDLNGRTALFAAVANGDESCCRALLEYGADAKTRDNCGRTALEVAVSRGSLNIVKCLIEHHADVNPNHMRCSALPLHVAIESMPFNYDIISHLLNSGADVLLPRFAGRYTDGKNAIDLADDRGQPVLAQKMRDMVAGSTTFLNYFPTSQFPHGPDLLLD